MRKDSYSRTRLETDSISAANRACQTERHQFRQHLNNNLQRHTSCQQPRQNAHWLNYRFYCLTRNLTNSVVWSIK